jgi:hypothetical protein
LVGVVIYDVVSCVLPVLSWGGGGVLGAGRPGGCFGFLTVGVFGFRGRGPGVRLRVVWLLGGVGAIRCSC